MYAFFVVFSTTFPLTVYTSAFEELLFLVVFHFMGVTPLCAGIVVVVVVFVVVVGVGVGVVVDPPCSKRNEFPTARVATAGHKGKPPHLQEKWTYPQTLLRQGFLY